MNLSMNQLDEEPYQRDYREIDTLLAHQLQLRQRPVVTAPRQQSIAQHRAHSPSPSSSLPSSRSVPLSHERSRSGPSSPASVLNSDEEEEEENGSSSSSAERPVHRHSQPTNGGMGVRLDEDEEEEQDAIRPPPTEEIRYDSRTLRREQREIRMNRRPDFMYARDVHHPDAVAARNEMMQQLMDRTIDTEEGRTRKPETRSERRLLELQQLPLTTDDEEAAAERDVECFWHVPVPLTHIQEVESVFDRKYSAMSECFGCRVGIHSDTALASTMIQRLVTMWKMNVMAVKPHVLAESMARVFEVDRAEMNMGRRNIMRLRHPGITEEELAKHDIKPWPAASIYYHFREHIMTGESLMFNILNDMVHLYNELRDNIKRVSVRNPKSVYYPAKPLAAYFTVTREIARLVKMDPSKFVTSNRNINPLPAASEYVRNIQPTSMGRDIFNGK